MASGNAGELDSGISPDQVLALVDREIWVVTAADAQRRGGLVATWVSAASIDPNQPTVLLGIAPHHFTSALIDASGGLGLHLLREDQVELAFRLASCSGRDVDKLAGLVYQTGSAGAPLLADCLAWLDCSVFGRLDAGDRVFYWADAVRARRLAPGAPLRERGFFGRLSSAQREQLGQALQHDLQHLRPAARAWRAHLPQSLRP